MLSFLKRNKNYKIQAVVDGSSIDIEKVNDSTFSQKIMGDGIAIIPDNGIVHIGVDTVDLKGQGFENKVSQGSIVKQGDPIITFERETLISQGIDCTTMVIILNQSEFSDIKCMTGGAVVAGQNTVIEVIK